MIHEELNKINLKVTHYGFYEDWDPYRNYLIAKEHCGLMESDEQNLGSYTNFAQNDQKRLHAREQSFRLSLVC